MGALDPMVMDRVWEAWEPVESVAWTVNDEIPVAVGVPEMMPLEESSVRPVRQRPLCHGVRVVGCSAGGIDAPVL